MITQGERRLSGPRLTVSIKAYIILPLRDHADPSVIQEISSAGARLQVHHECSLPKSFGIQIMGDKTVFYCDLAWRDGETAGVSIAPEQRGAWWMRSQLFSRKGAPSPEPGLPSGLPS